MLLCVLLNRIKHIVESKFTICYLAFILVSSVAYLVMHKNELALDIQGFHSWRQSWTQTNIKHFTFTHANILKPTINNTSLADKDMVFAWEFPIYQYIVGMLNRVIGYNLLHSRLVTFLFTVIGCALFGLWMRSIFKQNFIALIAFWMMLWLPVNYYYGINIQPDFLAYACSIASIYFMVRYHENQKLINAVVSILLFMLVCLQKLPYIIIGPALAYIAWHSHKKLAIIAALAFAVLPAYWWYHNKVAHFTGGAPQGILATDTYTINDLKNTIQFYWEVQWPKYFTGVYNIPLLIWGIISLLFVGIRKRPPIEVAVWLVSGAVFAFWVFELNMISYPHNYYVMLFMVPTTYLVCKGLATSIKPIAIYACLAMCALPFVSKALCDVQWHETHEEISEAIIQHGKSIQPYIPKDAKVITYVDVSGFVSLYHLDRQGTTWDKSVNDSGKIATLLKDFNGYFVSSDTTLVIKSNMLSKAKSARIINGIGVYEFAAQ